MPIRTRKQRQQKQDAVDPKTWLLGKLENLETEWQAGAWYMDLIESLYLCHLECWLVMEHRQPQELWDAWEARCRALGRGSELLAMNRILNEEKDRDRMLTELQAVKEQMLAAKPDTSLASVLSTAGGILDMLQGKGDDDE